MTHHYYNSFDPRCKTPFGAVSAEEAVQVRLFLPVGEEYRDPVMLIFEADRWQAPAAVVGLEYENTQDGEIALKGSFAVPFPGLYYYCFRYHSGQRRVYVGRGAGGEGVPLISGRGGLWQLTVTETGFSTPDRWKGGILYQIFPDRFCKGKMAQPPAMAGRELREDWGGMPKYLPDGDGVYRPNDLFGGNLAGITEKLDYLEELGVTALYLNPIFEAHSNHRYNTADYRKIDPQLGTEEDFKTLCAEAKKHGIAVILDGVFSHTGSDSRYFNREGRYPDTGAYQSRKSPYFSWYNFKKYPDSYDSWWGFKTLPEVTETDPAYLDFICGEEGVLAKWLHLGAAGWRLDVADELPDRFLDRLRSRVKKTDPQSLVIGEVWEDASCKQSYGQRRHYLLGHQLDSVMNYPFREAILDFAAGGGAGLFLSRVMTILEHYPKCVCDVLMNLLSTHDVERAITRLAGEPSAGRDRRWQAEHHFLEEGRYALGKALLKLSALAQYTLPGIPSLYYGDEAGMTGYRDPFNRCCYPWGQEDGDLVAFFRALGRFRRAHSLYAKGIFFPVSGRGSCAQYLRREKNRAVLTALNAGENALTLTLPAGFVPDGEEFAAGGWDRNTLRLEGRSGVLLSGSIR